MIIRMETVYVDSYFALNMVIDYLLLLCSGRAAGAELRRLRIALGALIGAVYAVLCLFPALSFLRNGFVKLASGLLMTVAAYGGEKRLYRCGVIFLCVTAAFGGAVWAVSLLRGGAFAFASPRVLILSFAVCYAVVSTAFRRVGTAPERAIVPLRLTLGERSVTVPALVDTGNSLCDPSTGRAAAVVEWEVLKRLVPDSPELPADAPAAEIMLSLSEVPALRGRLTLAPFSSLGTPGGLLPCVRPDRAYVNGEEKSVCAAVYMKPLSPDGSYNAII